MKELPGLGTKAINCPVEIFHPTLLVAQKPVINADKFFGDVMRILDGAHDAYRCRFAMPEFLNAVCQRLSGRPVAAARVGRDYQYLWRWRLCHPVLYSGFQGYFASDRKTRFFRRLLHLALKLFDLDQMSSVERKRRIEAV